MSGQVCQYFLQGRCKYGDRCRHIHQTGQRFGSGGGFGGGGGGGFSSNNSFSALNGNNGGGFGGSGGGGGSGFGQRGFGFAGNNNNNNSNIKGNQPPNSGPGAKKLAFDGNTILNDITQDRPLHELSSYGPGKEEPNLISGKDMQPEELRLMFYETQNPALPQITGDYSGLMAAATAAGAGPAGMQNAFMQKLQQLNAAMNQEIQNISKDPQGAYQYFMNNIRPSGGAASATSGPGNNAFGTGGSGFGQTAFGQPAVFGQPSAFGQTSTLGAAQSAFGIGGNTNNSFASGANNSAFANANNTNPFGGAGASNPSPFGTGGNVFSNTTTAQQTSASAFGSGGGFAQPSAFSQPSAFANNTASTGATAPNNSSVFPGSGFLGGAQQQQPAQTAFGIGGGNAFSNPPAPMGQTGLSGGNAFSTTNSTVSAGTLKMVQAKGIKSSVKGEPLTEEEIVAYRAPVFELKCIPEQEPPMELR
ncbi:hypothetical protein BGZ80_002995 [Entomortierella chlamydospora]|uniref:C3H1-type domain-containing protein n=1 Tax=Entomortierella chlamydospora TaxID=101097 RepID=A0A9P6T2Y8_9FUNG|nr:hypothetical protein BGZ79_005790 [Entomortierella chlamydospora]KAG0021113.1 hypothetical protein BGZ80_002995 [Entomortierella chlamydospora]